MSESVRCFLIGANAAYKLSEHEANENELSGDRASCRDGNRFVPNLGTHRGTHRGSHLVSPGWTWGKADRFEVLSDADRRVLKEIYGQFHVEINSAASKTGVPTAIIIAVIARETGGRNVIGDGGHGHGLMQIDDRSHAKFLQANSWGMEPRSNILYGAELLAENFRRFGRWDASLAAYNAGPARVQRQLDRQLDVDRVTTGLDYSTWVLTRASSIADGALGPIGPSTIGISTGAPSRSTLQASNILEAW